MFGVICFSPCYRILGIGYWGGVLGWGFSILTFVVVGRLFLVPGTSQVVILLLFTMPAGFT